METKIISETTKLIPRKELKIEIKFDNVTPKRLELKKAIAKKTNSKEELVIIRRIYNDYGKKLAIIEAYVYHDQETLNRVEQQKVIQKNTPKQEKVEEKKE